MPARRLSAPLPESIGIIDAGPGAGPPRGIAPCHSPARATPRPRPENVHLPRETATYPPAGTLWVEAIVLRPGRAVKEGVGGGQRGLREEHPISAVRL
jgi:hypothetical protein